MLRLSHLVAIVAVQATAVQTVPSDEIKVILVSVWEMRYESYKSGTYDPGMSGLEFTLELKGKAIASATHYGQVRIESAKDDRGNSLRAKKPRIADGNILNGFVPLRRGVMMSGGKRDEMLSSTLVHLAFSLPARDATKLTEIVGSLRLLTGRTETVIVENVKKRKGERIDNDVLRTHGIALTIRDAPGRPQHVAHRMGEVISLEVSGNRDRIVSVGLVKDDGESLFALAATSTSGDSDRTVYDLTSLHALPEAVALSVTVSPSDQEIEVPINLKDVRLPGSSAKKPPQGTVAQHATKAGPIPIVYHIRFDHPPLSDSQVEGLLNRAQPLCPQGQKVWFIYVTANWMMSGERKPTATVYFTPDEQTSRLRKGKYVFGMGNPIAEALRSHHGAKSEPRALREAREYWQVSLQDEPFPETVEVPDVSLLPFPKPTGFTEKEVIEIVDFIRTNPEHPEYSNVFNGSHPILSITRSDDVIEVKTGTIEGMLAGRGQLLTCKKKADGRFEVLSIGMWVS